MGDCTLSLDEFHLSNIIGKRQAYGKELFFNEEEFFDSAYDYDFTDLSDSAECTRGHELYERPKGWYRMALWVKGKYPDGDTWLGTNGWQNHSVPGENGLFPSMEHLWMELKASSGNTTEQENELCMVEGSTQRQIFT